MAMIEIEQATLRFVYAGYLAWLAAGCADFACHRLSRLPETSGFRECGLHVLQIVIVGAGVSLFLLMEPERGLLVAIAALAIVHAVFGYMDTRSAYGLRPITPVEQHLHSILDMAPWIALGMLAMIVESRDASTGWYLRPRDTPFPLQTWVSVLVPAFALVLLPVIAEWMACWRAKTRMKRRRHGNAAH
jgi:hypothetical protein